MTHKPLIHLIKTMWGKHKKQCDPDGFPTYPVEEQKVVRVAPLKEWAGTKKEWETAKKNQALADKYTTCDYCELCKTILQKLKCKRKT